MKKINVILFAVICGLTFTAQAANVALLKGNGWHDNEWDPQFKLLDWDVARFDCSPEGFKKFGECSAAFDMALIPPLFNWRRIGAKEDKKEGWSLNKDEVDFSVFRKYVQNGGVLIVTEAQYTPCREFFECVDPCLAISSNKCTSTPWVIRGHTYNLEPLHPLRGFPNTITERDNWAHFELPAGTKWQPLAMCSEGKPIAVIQDYGKGCFIFLSLRHNRLDALENYYAFAIARKYGVSVTSCELPPIKAGDAHLELGLASAPKPGTSLVYEFTDAKGDKVTFSTNIVGKNAVLDYNLAIRGPVRASFSLMTDSGKICLFTRNVVIPPLFAVKPNWYRGLISTKRRVDTVDFKVEFAPNHEDLLGTSVTFDVFDSASNKVATVEHLMPTNGVVELEQWLPVPLPKELGAGGYRIDATLTLTTKDRRGNREKVKSSTTFEILESKWNQVMIDDDGTFLVDGLPWMPLAIYHARPDEKEAMDLIADIGFNSMQLFFNWYHGCWGDQALMTGVDACSSRGLRLLYEGARVPKKPEWREFLRTHPATLAYYVADEPCEGAEPMLEENNDFWHNFDKDHPTYIDSCRPDLFHVHQQYCDILSSNGGGLDVMTGPATMGGHKCCCMTPGCERNSDFENPECYRANFYYGLAMNMRGFFWYCWSQRGGGRIGDGLKCQPKAQEVFRSMFKEAKTMFPGLLSTKRRPFKVGDNVYGMVCGDKPGAHFLLLTNISKEPVDIDIEVPEMKDLKNVAVPFALPLVQKKNAAGNPQFDNKKNPIMIYQTVPIENGNIKHSFPAYGTMVYNW